MTDSDSIFNAADTLAEFSNLVPGEIDAFYIAHPDFMPDLRGGGAVAFEPENLSGRSMTLWQSIQEFLRKTWINQFSLDGAVGLITFLSDISKMDARMPDLLTMSHEQIQEQSKRGWPSPKVWPFQRAVMFLTISPWRARYCLACGKRFVSSNPKGRFCSDTCFQKSLKGKKLQWWREHGDDLRKKKKKK
jgi:hypothetical protein